MHRMTSILNTHFHCQWKLLQAWALAPKVRDERKVAEELRIVWSNIHAKFLDKIHNIGGIFRHRVSTGRLEITWIANKLNFNVLPGMVSAWKLWTSQSIPIFSGCISCVPYGSQDLVFSFPLYSPATISQSLRARNTSLRWITTEAILNIL